jgi:hypothetical protein
MNGIPMRGRHAASSGRSGLLLWPLRQVAGPPVHDSRQPEAGSALARLRFFSLLNDNAADAESPVAMTFMGVLGRIARDF